MVHLSSEYHLSMTINGWAREYVLMPLQPSKIASLSMCQKLSRSTFETIKNKEYTLWRLNKSQQMIIPGMGKLGCPLLLFTVSLLISLLEMDLKP
jgi:hypothetical protein